MQRLRTATLAALALAGLAATPAAAVVNIGVAPTLTWQVSSQPLPADLTMIDTFDDPIADGFTFVGGFVRQGGVVKNVSAPPPGDTTKYLTVLGGTQATLTSVAPLKKLSLFMGSPDSFNSIRFIGTGFDWTLKGSQLWKPIPAQGGDQAWGRRLTYDFGAYTVKTVIFASGNNSFEFDDLAGSIAAVPEPASWALMLMGFFGAGALIRSRRSLAAVA